jgi:hypothetical protein
VPLVARLPDMSTLKAGKALELPAIHGLPVAGRLVLVALPLIAFASLLQRPLIEALMPWLALCTEALDTTYRTVSFMLRSGEELVLQRTVTLEETTVVGTQVLTPNPLGQAVLTTPAGHVLQPLVLALAIVLGWPVHRPIAYVVRLAMVAPLLAGVFAIDVPAVLAALPWQLHVDAFEPDRFSPLLIWKDMMQGGGRLALGLTAGLLAVVVSDRLRRGLA